MFPAAVKFRFPSDDPSRIAGNGSSAFLHRFPAGRFSQVAVKARRAVSLPLRRSPSAIAVVILELGVFHIQRAELWMFDHYTNGDGYTRGSVLFADRKQLVGFP